jgi:adenylate cyclase
MASTRRLAAIFAADVAGYSRLMGADEEGTHERLKTHFRQLIDPKIRENRGRTVKNTGDGLLAEFASVVDAMRCAAEVQRGMIDRENDLPGERRIRLRIGINLGDVIADEDDIFGDGVNVAARLEALAEPGGICISRTVRDQIRDKLAYPFEDRGEQQVKNIARPVRVYALRPEAIAELPASSAPPVASVAQPIVAPRLSIVVLPFANLSNDPEQQYFADGITEDLTTDLSRIVGMVVISRTTAFSYRNRPIDTRQIGRDLKVRYVLEGSIRASGERVRCNAQLIDAETDTHIWAERFDLHAIDLLWLQDEVTARIANALDLELVQAEAARPIANPDALDYVLRGRSVYNRASTPENFAEVIGLYESALALDPSCVQAKALMARTLTARVLDQLTDVPVGDLERAEALIAEVLAVSPRDPNAHLAKAQMLRAQNRYNEAIPEYEIAVALNRNWVIAIAALGQCKFLAGAIEEAIPAQEQAIRLSPRDSHIPNWYWRIGMVHLLKSRLGEAVEWLQKAQRANPLLPGPRAWLAAAYALAGDAERAAAELTEARRLGGDDRYSSIARFRRAVAYGEKTQALAETTFFAGLRKAGVPED